MDWPKCKKTRVYELESSSSSKACCLNVWRIAVGGVALVCKKAMAARDGVCLARSRGFQRIVLELDNKELLSPSEKQLSLTRTHLDGRILPMAALSIDRRPYRLYVPSVAPFCLFGVSPTIPALARRRPQFRFRASSLWHR
ncbi:hypothetical protein HU200_035366 [Digitaria exilis]|uniref:Uncharacterized protein n=1 Tax=Digitaria exilis TaxID=1010633 RepID=A0A835BI22_9POAL|nr:hypothetical protein HU200_035366 [Digitaria exilis]